MSSKLYHYYIENHKSGSFNRINRLPILDYSKPWTDETIYKHFDITEEEQHDIENYFSQPKLKGKRGRKLKQK
jgi:hypothetical protein